VSGRVLGPCLAVAWCVGKRIVHGVIAVALVGCGGVEGEGLEGELSDALGCTACEADTTVYGVDSVGDTCAAAAMLTLTGSSDEINTTSDVDAWKFTSDGAYHNYVANVAGAWGDANVDCSVKYYYSGSWRSLASDELSGLPNCRLSFTSNSVRTYCITVFPISGYASAMPVTTSVAGKPSDGSDSTR
jgi:hypothetical protein